MSALSAYTLSEALEMLKLYKEAERDLISGQATHYKIGTREFTSLDLDEIRRNIERLSNIVEGLQGKSRTSRVVRVVPRDL